MKMTQIEAAQNTLKELTAKLAAHEDRGVKLANDRRKISFAAIAGGNDASRKKLDALNHETALYQSELENLNSAIVEAQARLDTARDDENRKANREQAKNLRDELLPEFIAQCTELDRALAALVEAGNAAGQVVRRINAAGCATPNERLFHINSALAIQSAMISSPWHFEFRHLPPGDRRTFKNLLEGQIVGDGVRERSSWVSAIERRIAELDGADSKTAAAKAA
jgi:uncharacterized protein YhaN